MGALKARKIKNQADFSLAGRGISAWVLSGTLIATWVGTGTIFGYAEEAYRVGFAVFLLPLYAGLGIIILYFLSGKVRGASHFTIQDILEERFGVGTRVVGTITLLMAYTIIVSYQFRAGAAILERMVPDLGHHTALLAVAGFVILYTALAGMFSVAYTDVVNGAFFTLGLVLALFFLVGEVGGVSGLFESLPPGRAQLFGHYGPMHFLGVGLPVLLLVLGDANMHQRFFSAKSEKAAKKGVLLMLGGVFVVDALVIACAVVGVALVQKGWVTAPANPAHIIVHLAFNALPPFVGAILVTTVVAIIVSTADSYLLAPATSLVRDVYQRFINKNPSEKMLVRGSRLAVVLLGFFSFGLAFTSDEFFNVALFAYTIYGAGITPAFLAALLWKGATPQGALASMIVGVVTAIVWKFGVDSSIGAIIPAALLNIFTLVTVSLLTKKKLV